MFTGQVAHTIGTHELHRPIREGTKMLPDFLHDKGYYCGLFGKNHMGKYAASRFDVYDGGLGKWREFMDTRPKDKPFFLTIAFHDAHRPYQKGTLDPPHDPAKAVVPPYLVDNSETREELAMYYDSQV